MTTAKLASLTKAELKKARKALKARLGITEKRYGYFGIKASKEADGLNISTLSGKLEGIHSCSTSPETCEFCQRMASIHGTICELCFSQRSIIPEKGGYKQGLRASLAHNTDFMRQEHEVEDFPVLNDLVSRIQSHGETETVLEAVNFCKYCLRNPETRFTAWCKVPKVWDLAFRLLIGGKPKNLHMIYSSPMLNREVKIERIQKVFPWVEKVFTVFDLDYILLHPELESLINCGSRQCLACRLCYSDNDITQIREVLK